MLLLSKLYWDWGKKKHKENQGCEEGGEKRREDTGKGAGETGAWSLNGRSDYTAEGAVVCVGSSATV